MTPVYWILALLPFFAFLPFTSVALTGDQRVYLSIAWEMREAGSWLLPLLFGEPSYFKPPLQYWATLLSWEAFGVSLWAALLPSALAAVGAAAAVRSLARSFRSSLGDESASLSPLWFLSSVGALTFGWVAQMEIWLVLLHAGAWALGVAALRSSRPSARALLLCGAFLSAGLLALVKSPLHSVLFGAGFLAWIALEPAHRGMFRRPILYGAILLGALVGASWYLWVLGADRERFLADYVVRETVAKKGGNASHFLGIWGALAYWAFPATIPALFGLLALRRAPEGRSFLLLLACFALPTALFFTAYPYRVTTYLFPLVPALAWAASVGWRKSRFARFATGGLLALLLAAVAGLGTRASLLPSWISALSVLAACAALLAARSPSPRGILLAAIAACVVFRLGAASLGERDLRALRAEIERAPASPTLGFADPSRNIWGDGTRIALATGTHPLRIPTPDEAEAFVRAGGWMLICDSDEEAPFRERLAGLKDPSLTATPWARWKRRVRFPFGELLRHTLPIERMQRECAILRQ